MKSVSLLMGQMVSSNLENYPFDRLFLERINTYLRPKGTLVARLDEIHNFIDPLELNALYNDLYQWMENQSKQGMPCEIDKGILKISHMASQYFAIGISCSHYGVVTCLCRLCGTNFVESVTWP